MTAKKRRRLHLVARCKGKLLPFSWFHDVGIFYTILASDFPCKLEGLFSLFQILRLCYFHFIFSQVFQLCQVKISRALKTTPLIWRSAREQKELREPYIQKNLRRLNRIIILRELPVTIVAIEKCTVTSGN